MNLKLFRKERWLNLRLEFEIGNNKAEIEDTNDKGFMLTLRNSKPFYREWLSKNDLINLRDACNTILEEIKLAS